MISSNNERVFVQDLGDLTSQIVFDAWWASIDVSSKRPIGWTHSRHAHSWRFHSDCRIEQTSSPGIICIVCHQVLRHPSEHGTSYMGKHLLAKAHIAKLNHSTESEVTKSTSSMVNETALAILKRKGSWGIRNVYSQSQIIFGIDVDPYWPKWQSQRSKLADMDFETYEYHQDTWNRYPMLAFVLAHIPWNALSNRELWRSYEALRDDLMLPSATTLSNICQWDYAVSMDESKKQLLSHTEVSLALDGSTSPNKLAILSFIAYYIAQSWGLREVQLAFDEDDRLFVSPFECNYGW